MLSQHVTCRVIYCMIHNVNNLVYTHTYIQRYFPIQKGFPNKMLQVIPVNVFVLSSPTGAVTGNHSYSLWRT